MGKVEQVTTTVYELRVCTQTYAYNRVHNLFIVVTAAISPDATRIVRYFAINITRETLEYAHIKVSLGIINFTFNIYIFADSKAI